jgi:hypothetical protein
MELGKIQIEKVFSFIAAIIPGSVTIYVYYLANPHAFTALRGFDHFGYATKISIALTLAFVIGNSLQMFLYAMGYAIGEVFTSRKLDKQPLRLMTAPWRDPGWRKLAAPYLGEHTPNDTLPMSDVTYDLRLKMLEDLSEVDKLMAKTNLLIERASLDSDDNDWKMWYLQLNKQREAHRKWDVAQYVHGGLKDSFHAIAIYLTISMLFVPGVRNWMTFLFCGVWLFLMYAEVSVSLSKAVDPWSTSSQQIEFLANKALARGKSD